MIQGMKFDVITVGSATVDVFVYTDKSQLINIRTIQGREELIAYPCGSKILINELSTRTGGGGTNAAVGLARFGLKTGFLGVLGNDETALIIEKELKREKVSFIGQRTEGSCGYSVILDSIAHDRTILTYKGANDKLDFSKLKRPMPKAKWLYCSSMMGESFRSLEKIAQYARENSIPVLFNPSSYLAEKGQRFLGAMLRNTEILICNKEEAGLISGNQEIPAMGAKLLGLGPITVIITNGSEGAHAFHKGAYYFIRAHKVKVVEATGAGDAFASGFLGATIRKRPFEDCLRIGLANAEAVVRGKGAKVGLLTWDESRAHLKDKTIITKRKMA